MVSIFDLLKRCDLKVVRQKLFATYILNITDILFTIYLLHTGAFIELNSFMNKIINSSSMVFLIKILLPGVLIFLLCLRLAKANIKQLYKANIIIDACLIFYIVINLSHIIWSSYMLYVNTLY